MYNKIDKNLRKINFITNQWKKTFILCLFVILKDKIISGGSKAFIKKIAFFLIMAVRVANNKARIIKCGALFFL